MLLSLAIRNIVLIEALDLEWGRGLCTLTGETGAGKSILLDALSLVLGVRAESRLVRSGAEQGSVIAVFDVAGNKAAETVLQEAGFEMENPLFLRRIVNSDGKSRAFINDQPVSVSLLKSLGETLVEVHGQHDQRGLMETAQHREMLDAFGRLSGKLKEVSAAYVAWQDLQQQVKEAQAKIEAAKREEEYLRHSLQELENLAPEAGEEEELATRRQRMMSSEKLAESLNTAMKELTEVKPVQDALHSAQRILTRSGSGEEALFEKAIDALERAAVETAEAMEALQTTADRIEYDERELEQAEERLFALRAAARKYQVTVEELPALQAEITEKLNLLGQTETMIGDLERQAKEARAAYVEAAKALSEAREKASRKLEKKVQAELAPLKMEKTRFQVVLEPLPESQWGPEGCERVYFLAATNVGSHMAPLAKIASGGELSRFMLALKVALSEVKSTPVMVFDEVDTGIGGAVADAVGQRLERLGKQAQVLVVTHLPQVAAQGKHHYFIEKRSKGKTTRTSVHELKGMERKEELARMLAGAEITEEARAAAGRLMEGV